ncbi:MAG: hypothetical protein NTU80_12820 [Verrucomicrobia bacterium]|nr:hypothetical protein [Verrucomicrobiota bacterium]
MLMQLATPIAVVAHDAGAANHILAWLESTPAHDLRICVAGPAARLFREVWPDLKNLALAEALPGASSVITGTSGPGVNLENDARRLALQAGTTTVAVVDHWVNYAERFTRDGQVTLPDEIWVTDNYALELARAVFPPDRVHLKPNAYLEKIVAQVGSPSRPASDRRHVLYVLEPMRSTWGRGESAESAGEFQALEFFLSSWARLGWEPARTSLRLRLHPSEPRGKYDAWIRSLDDRPEFAGLIIAPDESPSLAAALGWADVVAGCESYALAMSLAAGRQAISTLPPWAPACRLPHREIVRLREHAV